MSSRRRVGFVGLGMMGRWMALNVLKAGHDLLVYARRQRAAGDLIAEGARLVASPADLATQCEVICLCLPDTDAVQEVLFAPKGIADGARSGLVVVDFSTISYVATLQIHGTLAEKGVLFADAPISGMEARAKDGTLTIMFGGDHALYSELLPLFETMGNLIVYMGGIGSGQLMKLINQLLFNCNMAAIAEVLPMAAKLGLDPDKVLQVCNTGTGRSFGLEFFGQRIANGRFRDAFPLKNAYKDMVSAAEVSSQRKIPLPMVQAATTLFQLALAEGLGDEDKGALVKVFERVNGVQFRRSGRSS